MKLFKISITMLLLIVISACASPKASTMSIFVDKPLWLSGIQVDGITYTKDFPKPLDNKYLKTVNAGYWLANTNGKYSQLVYVLELTNKKVFEQDIVYTKSIFSNPEDENKPIIYNGTLNNSFGSTKITHATVQNVSMNKIYHMIFEVYADAARTQLITRIDQSIQSPADNTNGCVELSSQAKAALFPAFNDTVNTMPLACGSLDR